MSDDESGAQPFKLPADWKLPKSWGDWALEERVGWKPKDVRKAAKDFHEYHTLKGNTRNSPGEWELAFRRWVRNESKIGVGDTAIPNVPTSKICGFPDCGCLGVHGFQGRKTGDPWYCWDHFIHVQQGAQHVFSFTTHQQVEQSEHP